MEVFPTEWARLADPLCEINPEVRESMIVSLPAPPEEARQICFMRNSGPAFDERDRQIAMLLRPHLQEIWLELFIEVGTVRRHMEHVRERLGGPSIPAAVSVAMPHTPAHLRIRSTVPAPRTAPRSGPDGGR